MSERWIIPTVGGSDEPSWPVEDIPVYYFDPSPPDPAPVRRFEVGDRIQIDEDTVVTVTGVKPAAKRGDGTTYTVA